MKAMVFARMLLCGLAGSASMSSAATPDMSSGGSETRYVIGQVLTSTYLPEVRLEFDPAFKYAGSQRVELYGLAEAEQHFFVDADEEGRIRRLYWIQFESYLPGNRFTYDYKVTKLVNLGGFDFIADALVVSGKDEPARPGSDTAHAQAFLKSKGFPETSDELMLQRLVHILGEDRRSEMMIMYVEDLEARGLSASALKDGSGPTGLWPKVAQDLFERASRNLAISK